MSLRLGDTAPDFEQDSSEGKISFHDWLGDSWGVLFSHPADFTPVCTTELGLTAKLKDQFAKRNVKAIALSVDPVDSHHEWIKDINETQGCAVNFPIIADQDRKVSELYDMIHPNADSSLTVRSLFVIDPNKKVRLIQTRLQTSFGMKNGLLITSIMFGIMHAGYGSFYELLITASAGILLGYMFQKTGSLVLVSFTHGFVNIFLFGLIPLLGPGLGLF